MGDQVDRGRRILDVLRLVRSVVHHGSALCVPGNHDVKLLKKLQGKQVQITHGLANTLAEFDPLCTTEETRQLVCGELTDVLRQLPTILPTDTAAIRSSLLPDQWANAQYEQIHASGDEELRADNARRNRHRAKHRRAIVQ